ncbi:glycoside hydrolase family 13 protein [Aquibacillus rhizosphaerae]|uniref:oligo-1,6-glucosidase n=1 Tax=Aquibacillus rhizosphaerae TaxID=3051431 RepID=A0ABT7LAJ1_9BACI|nr:alpha-glucosidase [Aquibacillus sp. LR5S19]MDL4842880.1 alpha-glucosidase [Aquibacillus sp. LR5S19]
MNKAWWKESVVYQIYPRSFNDSNNDGIGDILGIIEKLDYLKDLGIDVIWLSPVYESPNDDNGYDISNYQAIMAEFGTMADWNQLLKEIHRRDMKLMMDLVINHSSDEHSWFVESRKSKENAYRDYYIWRPGKDGYEPNNWESAFSGSAWQYNKETDDYFLHLFSKKQPDLNWENTTLRKEIYSMITWWLDKGVDGLRMDVINFISKDTNFPDGENPEGKKYVSGAKYFMNGPKIHDYLQEMNKNVLSKYDVMTVGEMPGATPEEAVLYTGERRDELNMVFHFEHMDIDSGFGGKWDVKPWSLITLKEILSKWQYKLEHDGWNSLYWNNHDQPRVVSRFGHDDEYRNKSAKMLATTLHMMKGTPYIYQGEEIGMTNVRFSTISKYRDIETLNAYKEKVTEGWPVDKIMQAIHIKSRDNARTPMQWDTTTNAGFTEGEPWIQVNPNYTDINVKQAIQDSNSIFHYYKQLIQLRKKYDIIVYGAYDLLLEDNQDIFAYTRQLGSEKLLIISNFTEKQVAFSTPIDVKLYRTHKLLISNYEATDELEDISLQPYETRVYYFSK